MNTTVVLAASQYFAIGSLLAFVAERLCEYFAVPVCDKVNAVAGRELIDKGFWLKYVVAIVGGLLAWGAGLNFFEGVFQEAWVGVVLSAAFVGGGSEFVHQLIGALGRANRPEE